ARGGNDLAGSATQRYGDYGQGYSGMPSQARFRTFPQICSAGRPFDLMPLPTNLRAQSMLTQGSFAQYPEDDEYRFSQDARYYGPAGSAVGAGGARRQGTVNGGGRFPPHSRHTGY